MEFEDCGIFGFDISFYQDNNSTPQKTDFNKMKNYGASFVVIKAGQHTYADEDFKDNWKNAKLAGLPRSAYWFCDKDSSGSSQANKFWSLVKDDQPEGMLFADFELGSWTDWTKLKEFLVTLQNLSKYPSKRIGIYTGYYFWMDYGPKQSVNRLWFSQFPLWLAAYSSSPVNVLVPPTWSECLMWQDGTPSIGYDVGVESKEIDHNKFNGNADKFKEYLGGVPSTPSNGGTVILYYADLKNGYTSNVRNSPSISGTVKTTITGPLTVRIISEKTVADGYDWYQIDSPTTGFIALTASYTNFRSAGTTQPTPYPVEVTVKMSDGSLWSGPLTKK